MDHPTTAYCMVMSAGYGQVLRNRPVTSFEEVLAIHRELPRNDIALFEGPDGEGAMWAFYPEVQDPKFWR